MKESCHTCECVISHIWMSHVHICINHTTHTNKSCLGILSLLCTRIHWKIQRNLKPKKRNLKYFMGWQQFLGYLKCWVPFARKPYKNRTPFYKRCRNLGHEKHNNLAVWCSVSWLQHVAVRWVEPRVKHNDLAVCCGVLQCAAVCCSVVQCVVVSCSVLQCAVPCGVVWCSKVQSSAMFWSVLQRVELCWHEDGTEPSLQTFPAKFVL